MVDPGDELITFDPCFMMYRYLSTLAGGRTVLVETYPDFRIDVAKVERAISSRTKCIVVNSPASPTGAVATAEEMRALAELCRRRDVLLISDEVYRAFCYDRPFVTPATWNEDVLVVSGFSKSHGMTGWRLGFAHGPSRLIQEMAKLQQFSFVCAPSMAQHGGVVAIDQDLTAQVAAYRRKRDMVVERSADRFELASPEGAFYAFPRAAWGSATEFVAEAIKHNVLIDSRQCVLDEGHSLPHLLCRRRQGAGPRARHPAARWRVIVRADRWPAADPPGGCANLPALPR